MPTRNHEAWVRCPECGKPYNARLDWLTCPHCGHVMKEGEPLKFED